MKKTLIALAALTAGAAFAQSTATISGSYGFGFQRGITNASSVNTTDGGITFAASEDLGGGMTASASLGMDLQGRSGAFAATDASMSLAGGFGTIKLGTLEAGNGITGRGFAGAPLSLPSGLDGTVLSGGTNVDIVSYTSPDLGGLKIGVSYTESGAGTGLGSAANTTGTTSAGISASYSAGAFSIGGDYTNYNRNAAASRLRVSASVDLGGVMIGAGVQNVTSSAGLSDNRQAAFGVSAPLGAVKVGFAYATNNQGGGSTLAKSGYGIGVQYDLSKRTNFNVSYGVVDGAVSNQYRARLLHSF